MKIGNLIIVFFSVLIIVSINSCGPKSISTGKENIESASEQWIPFNGEESVVFVYDTNKITFTSSARASFYENERYMTDQGSFIALQEDYYADLERQTLNFTSNSTSYNIDYYLERNKGDVGDWDLLKVIMADGNYYQNEIKIAVFNPSGSDLGEIYNYKKTLVLNGIQFDNVYYWTQPQRPFEIYYTKSEGVIAFKLSSQEIWILESGSTP